MRIATDHRSAILKTAARLFARKRFDEVLMEDVAAQVGVAKGTIYRFYPTKEKLYAAICFEWLDTLQQELQDAARGTGDAAVRLQKMIHRSALHYAERRDFYQVMVRQETLQAFYALPAFLQRRAAIRDLFAGVIREGCARRVFRGVSPVVAADLLLGMNASVVSADKTDRYPQKGEDNYNEELLKAMAVYDVPNMERQAKDEMARYVLQHPVHFAMIGVQKWLYFLGVNRQSGVWAIDMMEESKKLQPHLRLAEPFRHVLQELAFGSYYVLFYLFIFGLIWLCRAWHSMERSKRDRLSVIGLCFVLYLGEHFIIFPQRKYRFPLEPFMLMVAVAFLMHLLRRNQVKSKTGASR